MTEQVLLSETEFVDARGVKWCCRFGSMDLMDGTEACNISFASFEHVEKIPFGSLGKMVWYACRHMARVPANMIDSRHAMTREAFYEVCVIPGDVMMNAIAATMKALVAAFPTEDDAPGDGAADPTPGEPAAPGDGSTS